VKDYSRFVIAFFEVISESAPHIYHSALPLSPQTSIVHKLYEPYACPMGRDLQGSPISWEPIVAVIYYPTLPIKAVWSPCCRFIAVSLFHSNAIEVLDAVMLKRLNTFLSHEVLYGELSFSPDSRLLVCINNNHKLAIWDLQTGGLVTTSPSEPHISYTPYFSSTYSMDGKIIATAHQRELGTTTLSTYDLLSGTPIYSHYLLEGGTVPPIWTHGGCLQFATVKPESITIWEVGFTSTDTLVEVESLPAPDIDSPRYCLFLPTHFRLALTHQETVLIWDAWGSKFLLNVVVKQPVLNMSFSPDGCFFVCATVLGHHFQPTVNSNTYLWKESPTGYLLHQILPSNNITTSLLISPSGESIIRLIGSGVQLWHTADPIPILSNIPAQSVEQTNFVLEFSPDNTLAVVAQSGKNMVVVLNLKSGNLQLTVDTGMKVLALRVTGSTIVVVGEGQVVTWNLPAEDCDLNASANINDSIQTAVFNYPALSHFHTGTFYTSISPDCNHIALGAKYQGSFIAAPSFLRIYNISTGKCVTTAAEGMMPWFTLDGHEVWCVGLEGWTIVEDSESDLIKLEQLGPPAHPLGGFPWQSYHGYEVRHDRWVFSPSKKRIFWLPHHWRSQEYNRKWGRQSLGLLHYTLLAAVILEFYE
jgi:WD40 repeat protein